MYKNLIFDVDGTIIDTLPCIADSLNYTLKKFNQNYSYSDNEVKNFVGYGTPYLINKAFKTKNIPLDDIIKIYIPKQLEIHLKRAKVYPYLLGTLKSLQALDYKLFIASNKPIEITPKLVNKLFGKGFFIDISCPSKDTPKKPDPYLVNELIKKNKLNKKECLYIGDGEADLLTAKNAGIDSCLVKYGYGQYGKFNESLAKFFINKPYELLDFLK